MVGNASEAGAGRGPAGMSTARVRHDGVMATGAPRRLAWTVVVPVKGGPTAKSRLVAGAGHDHEALALALALDTLDAVAAAGVAALVVVTRDPRVARATLDRGARVVPDPGAGLNAAVEVGLAAAVAASPDHGVAVLLGDLPALRPRELTDALAACADHARAVVPDREGTGTVLLTARPPVRLRPEFGAGSAARHARHATRLDLDLPGLRSDVDDAEGLAAARVLGLGVRTAAIVEEGHHRAAPATRRDTARRVSSCRADPSAW